MPSLMCRPLWPRARPLRRTLAAATVAVALVAGGCGSEESTAPAGGAPASAPASPDPVAGDGALAANAAQADQFVGDDQDATTALTTRLAALEGNPVVVNQWASWCPPCRAEMPIFEQATASFSDDVAFLGLDLTDDRGAAASFLDEVPSGFPSIFDEDGAATQSLGGGRASPSTFFFDAEGKQVHTKIGSYVSLEELEGDLREFAGLG